MGKLCACSEGRISRWEHLLLYFSRWGWVQLQREVEEEALTQSQSQKGETAKRLAPRHLSWLFLRNPEHLEKQDKQILSHIRQTQQADVVYGLAQQFVTMVKERNAKTLETWLRDCQKSGIGDLATFAQGLEKERSAFYAALTLPYSNDHVA